MHSYTGYICLTFLHHVFSNVSSDCLLEMMHNRIDCICLNPLQCYSFSQFLFMSFFFFSMFFFSQWLLQTGANLTFQQSFESGGEKKESEKGLSDFAISPHCISHWKLFLPRTLISRGQKLNSFIFYIGK